MNIRDQQVKLIALVDEFRDQECRKLMESARLKCRHIVKAEYHNAKQQVHQAVRSERERAISMIRSAEAELHTRHRAKHQRFAQSLLKVGWTRLEQVLLEKWLQPDERRCWIKSCAKEAINRLPSADCWFVQYPADMTEDDLSLFKNIVSEWYPELSYEMSESDIQAGLVMSANQTFLNMSLAGILRDRQNIEGRILALFQQEGEQ